ncbi:MAG: hypothetical protein GY842_05850, partial [bacterium]|nr:hypothetical protein [bacterium]
MMAPLDGSRRLGAIIILGLAAGQTTTTMAQLRGRNVAEADWSNRYDRARAAVLAERAADWRNGAIVYQVIVDRFAPSDDLDAKRHLYPAPKRLRAWS